MYSVPARTARERAVLQRCTTFETTARGFEPLRAEPNGFRVHLLNRSDTLSWSKDSAFTILATMKQARSCDNHLKKDDICIASEREQQLLVWPNGYGASLLRRRLRVRVPPRVLLAIVGFAKYVLCASAVRKARCSHIPNLNNAKMHPRLRRRRFPRQFARVV